MPFEGKENVSDVLTAKHDWDPHFPTHLESQLPKDLAELCLDLLAHDPASRPDGQAVLIRLGQRVRQRETRRITSVLPETAPTFVGRTRELERLRAIVDEVQTTRIGRAAYIVANPGLERLRSLRRSWPTYDAMACPCSRSPHVATSKSRCRTTRSMGSSTP